MHPFHRGGAPAVAIGSYQTQVAPLPLSTYFDANGVDPSLKAFCVWHHGYRLLCPKSESNGIAKPV